MSEQQNRQQLGDGKDDPGQAARQMSKAAKQANSAASKASAVGSGSSSAASGAAAGGNAAAAAASSQTAAATATANAAAASVNASVQAGQAVTQIAAGTASGGPWGAIIAIAWSLRHTLFKILISTIIIMMFFGTLIASFPSVMFETMRGGTEENDYQPMGLEDSYSVLTTILESCISLGHDNALERIAAMILEGGYDHDLSMDAVVDNSVPPTQTDICYILAAYSVSKSQDGTSVLDMKSSLSGSADGINKVTSEDKSVERVIPLEYAIYEKETLTVVTGKTETGTIDGVAQYRYDTATMDCYNPSGMGTTVEPITRDAYEQVTVELPTYGDAGAVVGTTSKTCYKVAGSETLTPEIEVIPYVACTIWPVERTSTLVSFGVDPSAQYGDYEISNALAIETMSQILQMTLFGGVGDGYLPAITQSEMLNHLNSLQTTPERKKLVEIGMSIVGQVPYFWGGKSTAGWNQEWGSQKKVEIAGSSTTGQFKPYGLDCSGYVDWVYKTALGVGVPGSTASQWANTVEITEDQLQPGDLGFKLDPTVDDETNHVMMYAGKDGSGNKLWLHCTAGPGVVFNSPGNDVPFFRRVPLLNSSVPAIPL